MAFKGDIAIVIEIEGKLDGVANTVVIQVKIYQNELMVEIYSNSLIRAIG